MSDHLIENSQLQRHTGGASYDYTASFASYSIDVIMVSYEVIM